MAPDYKSLYDSATDFVLNLSGVDRREFEKELFPIYSKPADIKEVYFRFVESAQNMQSLPNVIGGSIGGVEQLKEVLCDFDPQAVVSKYSRTDNMRLFEEIKKTLKPSGALNPSAKGSWPKYCRAVIDSAYFLQNFDTGQEFHEWIDSFDTAPLSKPALPLIIASAISGIGFALACDIIKELGHDGFGKPDTHIIDIVKGVGLLEYEVKGDQEKIEIMKILDEIAIANNVTAFNVDKVFWLIGSGALGNDIRSSKKRKEAFVSEFLASNENQ